MMCKCEKVLVRHSKYRYISACHCAEGVMHMSWDVATFHLSMPDFHNFVDVVFNLKPSLESSQEVLVNHVWLGKIGLALTKEDHTILKNMLETAQMQLKFPLLPNIANVSNRLVN